MPENKLFKKFFMLLLLAVSITFYGYAENKFNAVFGNPDSKVSIYLFTDWFCPGCMRLEPKISIMFPDFDKDAKIFFIDKQVIPETKNYTPYNLAFMINNKDDYLKIRPVLQDVALKHRKPTQEQITKAMEAIGVKYQPLSEADLKVGKQFFEDAAKKYDVDATPTVVVVNESTNEFKKFEGSKITRKNLLDAVAELGKKNKD